MMPARILFGLALCSLGLPHAQAQRWVRAKVAEPVLEELMGGCSMRCTFTWTVEANEAGKRSAVKMLNDEKATTAWVAEVPGMPEPVMFRLSFPKRIPAEMEGQVPFYGFDLINGHWSEELWPQYGRIKKARILYNDRVLGHYLFGDSRRWQRLTLPDIMVRSGDVITVEVLEIYPGENGRLAVSEFVLQGAH